jgi:penicillin-binding protein 1C
VKTGTSKDMRDNWAVGWSQRYTVGVWVGNASGAPMWEVSGTTGAAPIWAAVMNHLHTTQGSRAPRPPAGVVEVAVQFDKSGSAPVEAARKEWFLAGTQQPSFAITSGAANALHSGARGHITAPTTGTVIALDPDIPQKNQRVTFLAEGTNLRWLLDGKVFAKGASAQWLPWPGRHVVRIVDGRGQVLDEVRIEVRGAGVVDATGGTRR